MTDNETTRTRSVFDHRGRVLVAVICSTVWLWPHLLRFRDVPDRGDPVFSAWRLARFAHQLAFDPAHLFDGNILHPRPLTLAYSDATVLQGLIAAPFLWLGVDPLVAANALFFMAFPACAVGFFAAAYSMTRDPDAALVSGVLGAWYPFHGEHYSHLELQWFMFAPLAIAALVAIAERPTHRRGLLLGMAAGAQWLACMYIGVMLLTLLVPVGLVLLVRPPRADRAQRFKAFAVAAAILAISLLTAIPYVISRDARGQRDVQSINAGSAVPGDYMRTHRRMATYNWRSREGNVAERELAPGLTVIGLAVVGLLGAPARVGAALAVGTLFAFDASLGVNGTTYPWLLRLLPPYQDMRVPARFAVLVGTCLVLLGGFGAHRLLRMVPSRLRTAATVVLAALVLYDLRLSTGLVRYWPAPPEIYKVVDPSMVLAEFPRSHEIDYMYFSTSHWASLLGGYSGYVPADPDWTRASLKFASDESVALLRQLGATHLTYNCAFERSRERCVHTLRVLGELPGLDLIASTEWNGGPVSLYRITR